MPLNIFLRTKDEMVKKAPWDDKEDEGLRKLVGQMGVKRWTQLSLRLVEQIGGEQRSGKQCRQRWLNVLVRKDKEEKQWTSKQEQMLWQLHEQYGSKWTKLAQHLPGRSQNCIKNHFYSTIRRRLRGIWKASGSKISTEAVKNIKSDTLSYIFGAKDCEPDLPKDSKQMKLLRNQCERLKRQIIDFQKYDPKDKQTKKQIRPVCQQTVRNIEDINQKYYLTNDLNRIEEEPQQNQEQSQKMPSNSEESEKQSALSSKKIFMLKSQMVSPLVGSTTPQQKIMKRRNSSQQTPKRQQKSKKSKIPKEPKKTQKIKKVAQKIQKKDAGSENQKQKCINKTRKIKKYPLQKSNKISQEVKQRSIRESWVQQFLQGVPGNSYLKPSKSQSSMKMIKGISSQKSSYQSSLFTPRLINPEQIFNPIPKKPLNLFRQREQDPSYQQKAVKSSFKPFESEEPSYGNGKVAMPCPKQPSFNRPLGNFFNSLSGNPQSNVVMNLRSGQKLPKANSNLSGLMSKQSMRFSSKRLSPKISFKQ